MATGQVVTSNGKKIILNRLWKSSPDYTIPSVFKIGTDDTTPTEADTDLGTAVNINGSTTKTFVSGYPVLDETNLTSKVRCLVLTTEANGNTLVEFGLFNTDGTAKMFSRAVHTSLSKTSDVQVIYVEKDKLS